MIVRIMGEGQYKLSSSMLDELNIIDNRIVEYVAAENEKEFTQELIKLINVVKEKGEPLDVYHIIESDIIVPPEDLTMEEAREVFCGCGLIED
jgi:predicted RecB family nuclease